MNTNEQPVWKDFYGLDELTPTQAYSRGLHQGYEGEGPFGIWFHLEENPTPTNAILVSQWLRGWAKGRQIYLNNQQHI